MLKEGYKQSLILPGWTWEAILPTITDKACEWITAQATTGKPFFLYLPLPSPHSPISPTKEWQGKSVLGKYGDYVMETDAMVGRVLDALAASGAASNTLVIFTSDNGRAPEGQNAESKTGHYSSEFRRGYKGDVYDGGHRMPFIVRWPSKIKAGTTSDQLICLTDLMATCADILGAKLPDTVGEDSVSILPALLGTADKPLREAVVHHSRRGDFAIRQGQWKLTFCSNSNGRSVPRPEDNLPPIQLYDMAKDVGERSNEYAAHPEIVANLTKLMEKYIAEGRSIPGAAQKNDAKIELYKDAKKPGLKK
jgi:arylsulfatase A-like enzyme